MGIYLASIVITQLFEITYHQQHLYYQINAKFSAFGETLHIELVDDVVVIQSPSVTEANAHVPTPIYLIIFM